MISETMERAYRDDLKLAFIQRDRNEYWRKRILDIEEHSIPDYVRPLKYIPRVKKTRRITSFFKQLIP